MALENILYLKDGIFYEFKIRSEENRTLKTKLKDKSYNPENFEKLAENYSFIASCDFSYDKDRKSVEEQEAIKSITEGIKKITNHFIGDVTAVITEFKTEDGHDHILGVTGWRIPNKFDIYRRK